VFCACSALLLGLTAKIHGQNGFQKQGNILLDSGAQISRYANTLRQEFLCNNYQVGGEEETIKTKIHKVPVSLHGNTKCHQLRSSQLYAFLEYKPRESEEPRALCILAWLIPISTGQTKQSGHLVARSTPLAWVILVTHWQLHQCMAEFLMSHLPHQFKFPPLTNVYSTGNINTLSIIYIATHLFT